MPPKKKNQNNINKNKEESNQKIKQNLDDIEEQEENADNIKTSQIQQTQNEFKILINNTNQNNDESQDEKTKENKHNLLQVIKKNLNKITNQVQDEQQDETNQEKHAIEIAEQKLKYQQMRNTSYRSNASKFSKFGSIAENNDNQDEEEQQEKLLQIQQQQQQLNVQVKKPRQQSISGQSKKPVLVQAIKQKIRATVLMQPKKIEVKVAPLSQKEIKEMRTLSAFLGIDYDNEKEKEYFGKMLREMVNIDMHEQWVKEIDPDMNIVYYNKLKNHVTKIHPMSNCLRQTFYEILEQRYKVESGDEPDQQKDLQQKKMNRRKTNLPNMKRKQSFIQAFIPTMIKRKMSLMTQPIEEKKKKVEEEYKISKFFTEDGKSKDRFNALLGLLGNERKKQGQIQKNINMQNKGLPNLADFELLLTQATDFYENIFDGYNIKFIKLKCEQMTEFLRVDPDEVVNAVIFLNLHKYNAQMYWIARTYISLPLPVGWKCIHVKDSGKLYWNYQVNQQIKQHPSYLFIQRVISVSKEDKNNKDMTKQKQTLIMVFEDLLLRKYSLDIGEMVFDKFEKIQSENIQNPLDIISADMNDEEINKNLIKKKIESITENDETLFQRVDLNKYFKKKKFHQRVPSNLKDNHIFVLVKQLKINIRTDMHLLSIINEYLIYKENQEKQNLWRFRQFDEKNYYWIQKRTGETQKMFPYREELKKLIDIYKQIILKETKYKNIHFKANIFTDLDSIAKHKDEKELEKLINDIRKESREFVLDYLIANPTELQFVNANNQTMANQQLKVQKQNQEDQQSIVKTINKQDSSKMDNKNNNDQDLLNNSDILEYDFSQKEIKGSYKLKYVLHYYKADQQANEHMVKQHLLFLNPWDILFQNSNTKDNLNKQKYPQKISSSSFNSKSTKQTSAQQPVIAYSGSKYPQSSEFLQYDTILRTLQINEDEMYDFDSSSDINMETEQNQILKLQTKLFGFKENQNNQLFNYGTDNESISQEEEIEVQQEEDGKEEADLYSSNIKEKQYEPILEKQDSIKEDIKKSNRNDNEIHKSSQSIKSDNENKKINRIEPDNNINNELKTSQKQDNNEIKQNNKLQKSNKNTKGDNQEKEKEKQKEKEKEKEKYDTQTKPKQTLLKMNSLETNKTTSLNSMQSSTQHISQSALVQNLGNQQQKDQSSNQDKNDLIQNINMRRLQNNKLQIQVISPNQDKDKQNNAENNNNNKDGQNKIKKKKKLKLKGEGEVQKKVELVIKTVEKYALLPGENEEDRIKRVKLEKKRKKKELKNKDKNQTKLQTQQNINDYNNEIINMSKSQISVMNIDEEDTLIFKEQQERIFTLQNDLNQIEAKNQNEEIINKEQIELKDNIIREQLLQQFHVIGQEHNKFYFEQMSKGLMTSNLAQNFNENAKQQLQQQFAEYQKQQELQQQLLQQQQQQEKNSVKQAANENTKNQNEELIKQEKTVNISNSLPLNDRYQENSYSNDISDSFNLSRELDKYFKRNKKGIRAELDLEPQNLNELKIGDNVQSLLQINDISNQLNPNTPSQTVNNLLLQANIMQANSQVQLQSQQPQQGALDPETPIQLNNNMLNVVGQNQNFISTMEFKSSEQVSNQANNNLIFANKGNQLFDQQNIILEQLTSEFDTNDMSSSDITQDEIQQMQIVAQGQNYQTDSEQEYEEQKEESIESDQVKSSSSYKSSQESNKQKQLIQNQNEDSIIEQKQSLKKQNLVEEQQEKNQKPIKNQNIQKDEQQIKLDQQKFQKYEQKIQKVEQKIQKDEQKIQKDEQKIKKQEQTVQQIEKNLQKDEQQPLQNEFQIQQNQEKKILKDEQNFQKNQQKIQDQQNIMKNEKKDEEERKKNQVQNQQQILEVDAQKVEEQDDKNFQNQQQKQESSIENIDHQLNVTNIDEELNDSFNQKQDLLNNQNKQDIIIQNKDRKKSIKLEDENEPTMEDKYVDFNIENVLTKKKFVEITTPKQIQMLTLIEKNKIIKERNEDSEQDGSFSEQQQSKASDKNQSESKIEDAETKKLNLLQKFRQKINENDKQRRNALPQNGQEALQLFIRKNEEENKKLIEDTLQKEKQMFENNEKKEKLNQKKLQYTQSIHNQKQDSVKRVLVNFFSIDKHSNSLSPQKPNEKKGQNIIKSVQNANFVKRSQSPNSLQNQKGFENQKLLSNINQNKNQLQNVNHNQINNKQSDLNKQNLQQLPQKPLQLPSHQIVTVQKLMNEQGKENGLASIQNQIENQVMINLNKQNNLKKNQKKQNNEHFLVDQNQNNNFDNLSEAINNQIKNQVSLLTKLPSFPFKPNSGSPKIYNSISNQNLARQMSQLSNQSENIPLHAYHVYSSVQKQWNPLSERPNSPRILRFKNFQQIDQQTVQEMQEQSNKKYEMPQQTFNENIKRLASPKQKNIAKFLPKLGKDELGISAVTALPQYQSQDQRSKKFQARSLSPINLNKDMKILSQNNNNNLTQYVQKFNNPLDQLSERNLNKLQNQSQNMQNKLMNMNSISRKLEFSMANSTKYGLSDIFNFKDYFEQTEDEIQTQNLSALADEYSNYRVHVAFQQLISKTSMQRFDLRDGNINRTKQQRTNEPLKYFQQKANQELENLKNKSIKKKIDIIIFQFIIGQLQFSEEAKENLLHSDIIQSKFYAKNRKIFNDIRNFVLKRTKTYLKKNMILFLQDIEIDSKFQEKLYQLIRENKEIFQQIEDINTQIKEDEVYYFKQVLRIDTDILSYHDEDLENNTQHQHEFLENLSDPNPFLHQYNILSTPLFVDNLYEPNLKRFDDSGEDNIGDDDDSGDEQKQDKEIINKNENESNKSFDDENQNKNYKLILTHKKHDYKKNAKLLKTKYMKKDLYRKREINKRDYNNMECLFLYKNLIKLQEIILFYKKTRPIVKSLIQELGDFHLVNREIIRRFEGFLDYGLTPQHVMRMCQRLCIDTSKEGDLVFVAYLYSVFLLRYAPMHCELLLESVLKQEEQHNLYDEYFFVFLEFCQIKRAFLIRNLNKKSLNDYSQQLSWMKFYDKQKDKFYFFNFVTQKKQENLKNHQIFQKEKYETLEKVLFIEVLQGLVDIIQEKVDENQPLLNNQLEEQDQNIEQIKEEEQKKEIVGKESSDSQEQEEPQENSEDFNNNSQKNNEEQ